MHDTSRKINTPRFLKVNCSFSLTFFAVFALASNLDVPLEAGGNLSKIDYFSCYRPALCGNILTRPA